jgi:hypothetical protein
LVEATTAARWMYEKAVFRVQLHFSVKAGGSFEGRPVERLFFMTRPRSSDGKYREVGFVGVDFFENL